MLKFYCFMTWGRKNGDKELCKKFPDLCSYIGMQNKLSERYYLIASKISHVCCSLWDKLGVFSNQPKSKYKFI